MSTTKKTRKSSSLTKTLGLFAFDPTTPRPISTATTKHRNLKLILPSTPDHSKHADLLERVIEFRKTRKNDSASSTAEGVRRLDIASMAKVSQASTLVFPATARHSNHPQSINVPDEDYIDHPDSFRIRSDFYRASREGTANEKRNLVASTDDIARKTFNSVWSSPPPRTAQQQSRIGSPLNNPYLDRPVELEDIYKAAKEVGGEIRAIAMQEYDEGVRNSMRDMNVKEFLGIQKTRVSNLSGIIEKIFIPKGGKESKMNQELWKLVSTELLNVRAVYENFMLVLDDSLYKVSTGKEKITHQVDVWKALGLVLDYSTGYRNAKDSGRAIHEDRNLGRLQHDIMKFKLDYKLRKGFDATVMEMYESVERHISQLNEMIDNEKDRYNFLSNQHKRVMESFQELEGRNNGIKGDFMKMIQEWKESTAVKQDAGLSGPHQQYLENRLKELQEENEILNIEKEEWKTKMKKSKDKINELKALVTKGKTQDKMVMANFYTPNQFDGRLPSLSSYFIQTDLFSNGSLIPDNLAWSMINMIYTDKMIADIEDDYEKRPRKTLYEYMPQWFLKKFGIYTFCESIIQDFLYTIHYERNPHSRIRMFQALLGTQNLMDFEYTGIISRGYNELDPQKMKKECYRTAEATKRFLKIINNIKFPTMIATSPGPQSNANPQFSRYGPFLPGLGSEEDVIDSELAKQVLYTIMREEHFSEAEVKISEEHFNLIQQRDLYERLMESSKTAAKKEENKDNKENRCVKIDLFAKVVLDLIIDKDIKALEKNHTLLKANMSGRSDQNITYDEFSTVMGRVYPAASQSWKERSFVKFVNIGGGDQVPLSLLMLNFVSNYYREDEVKDPYYRIKMKKESILTNDIKEQSPGKKDTKKHSQIIQAPQQPKTPQTQAIPGTETLKAIGGIKEAFATGHTTIDDAAYDLYDAVSSLIMLQEVYEITKETFVKSEKKNEIFARMHEEFVNEVGEFFRTMNDVVTPDALIRYGKKDLVCYIEYLWMKYRQMLAYSHRLK